MSRFNPNANCHDLRYHAAIGALADQLPTPDFIEFEQLRN